jgi:hypothetical protein
MLRARKNPVIHSGIALWRRKVPPKQMYTYVNTRLAITPTLTTERPASS